MPFENFAPPIAPPTDLRAAITAAYRRPERECLAPLIQAAKQDDHLSGPIEVTARKLVTALRSKDRGAGVEALVQEYALSSQEGVALMCLAEALLRIPDARTRDALIRDKVANGDWKSHLGPDRQLFVNAATWGLVVTRTLVQSSHEDGLGAALTRLIARAGEPVIRSGVDLAMRLLGEQFVVGETIGEALKRARALEQRAFSYSYDMLGEAATTAADAAAYLDSYTSAIHAIGKEARGRGPYGGPGISIKLSALHPRYSRAQSVRVMTELLPRVRQLARLAKSYDIGLNIDAEEADRLELSLDLLESLALDKDLAGWNGLGYVVQAYGKRCPFVIDWIVDLARRSGRRLMVRLVKGAYWDAEIKRAQVDGLPDFPVYTRKAHTDIAYLACARKLLGARDAVFPQFATHNAQSLAAVYHMAGPEFSLGDYEFQCLHGMGQPLYDEVVGPDNLDRPCRIYAPVGTHETLLAYLVRRLLENGANSSFVNRIADPDVPVSELTADPVTAIAASADPGAPHDQISLPENLFPDRRNSSGLDISSEAVLASLAEQLPDLAKLNWSAAPPDKQGTPRAILNPGDHRDVVGQVIEVTPDAARAAVRRAAASMWPQVPVNARADCLDKAADALDADLVRLVSLAMREAGKTLPNAISEIREAVDFLRFYAGQARTSLGGSEALGPVVCISPWNFPLAIFIGQVSAALVAGNPVLAKPAEETPLIAAQAVRILHACGVPSDALQLVPGDGAVGAALVGADETAGVMFTGSTEVARLIQRQLSGNVSASGGPIPLIAETGGQNAMIVDSSALPEQVVADVIASAFDSAGQRCSALRILCLQEDIADRTLTMLKGAMAELKIGSTDRLSTDVGPVIHAEARDMIERHVAAMAAKGHSIHKLPLPPEAAHGTYAAPALIEIGNTNQLGREVFGPVLHVIRFRRAELGRLITNINATGYGLTFGLHTRIDSTIEEVLGGILAGNLYVNRNTIGATVGVQPFGGLGLSGTGPKAGGPLYLSRLCQHAPSPFAKRDGNPDAELTAFIDWLSAKSETSAAAIAGQYGAASPSGRLAELPGPVGERNLYALQPKGTVLIRAKTVAGLFQQIAVVLATGNRAHVSGLPLPPGLPESVTARLTASHDAPFEAALLEGGPDDVIALQGEFSARPGSIVTLQSAQTSDCDAGMAYRADWLCNEVSTSINTTAAGGNASLMAMST